MEKKEALRTEAKKLTEKITEIDRRRSTNDGLFKETLENTEKEHKKTQKELEGVQKSLNESRYTIESLIEENKSVSNLVLELKKTNNNLNREIFDLKSKLETELEHKEQTERRIKRMKEAFDKEREEFEGKMEDNSNTLKAKTVILEDKVKEIEQLKAVQYESETYIEDLKIENANEIKKLVSKKDVLFAEVENLKSKLANANDLIDKYEIELSDKNNEIDELREELKELEDDTKVEELRKREADLRKLLDAKEARVNEMNEIIPDLKKTIIEKNAMIDSLTHKLNSTNAECLKTIDARDKEISILKTKLLEADQDVKTLMFELERKKKEAKQNLDKLQILFS